MQLKNSSGEAPTLFLFKQCNENWKKVRLIEITGSFKITISVMLT